MPHPYFKPQPPSPFTGTLGIIVLGIGIAIAVAAFRKTGLEAWEVVLLVAFGIIIAFSGLLACLHSGHKWMNYKRGIREEWMNYKRGVQEERRIRAERELTDLDKKELCAVELAYRMVPDIDYRNGEEHLALERRRDVLIGDMMRDESLSFLEGRVRGRDGKLPYDVEARPHS